MGATGHAERIARELLHTYGRWWDRVKASYLLEFVEWVEEQRSQAA